MAIVEKYEQFISYFYPVLQNVPRKHGVARGATERLNAFVAAWVGHAKWADAHNLLRSLRLETSDDPA